MNNYKDLKKINLGDSDIATLVIVGIDSETKKLTATTLEFNEDGNYSAYLIDESAEIPEHYNQVAEFSTWLKVYDDTQLMQELKGDTITIYRAGAFGCIIKITK